MSLVTSHAISLLGPAPQLELSLGEVLAELTSSLRQSADAVSLRTVEVLCERIFWLDDARTSILEAATHSQRAAGRTLAACPPAEHRGRDVARLLRSLARAVDIVDTWPAGSEPPPERLALHHARCDLGALIRDCCAAFRNLAIERKLDLRVVVPPSLPAVLDPDKVQRVILNLLFNAFKMTDHQGTIEVVVEHEESIGEAVVRVIDSGAGVESADQEVIFARHRQADRSGPLEADWLGFDLAASRDYIELHGGGLRLVARPPGAGAEFCAHLPLSPPPGTPLHDTSAPAELPDRVARVATQELHIEARLDQTVPVHDHRPLVLVVEDSRVIQRVVAGALSDWCNLVSAMDGRSGLRMAADLCPDLIVTDLGLPELDGADMVRAIRARAELDRVPILVVSARRDAAETVRLLRDGVQDVMSKPFLVEELEARAHNLLEAKRARDVLGELLGQRENDLGRLAADVTRKQRGLEAALEELHDARALAEGASRVKSNFLRMMSHELKTPVTALVLQMQMLAQDQALSAQPGAHAGLSSMSRSISRLLHIVETVLEWARVERGRFRSESDHVDLTRVMCSATKKVAPQAAHKGLTLDVDLPQALPAVTDRHLVEIIAINLLERAISITPHGRVGLSLRHADGRVSLRVIDGGPPLSLAEREELFEALGPDRDLRRTHGFGSGLGLHVVRDLTGALGGSLAFIEPGLEGPGVELTFNSLPDEQGAR